MYTSGTGDTQWSQQRKWKSWCKVGVDDALRVKYFRICRLEWGKLEDSGNLKTCEGVGEHACVFIVSVLQMMYSIKCAYVENRGCIRAIELKFDRVHGCGFTREDRDGYAFKIWE